MEAYLGYLGCMLTDGDEPEVRPEVELEVALTASAADTDSNGQRPFQKNEVAKLCVALEAVGGPAAGCCCSKIRRVSSGPSASATPVAVLLRQAQKGVFWAFDLLARRPRLCL